MAKRAPVAEDETLDDATDEAVETTDEDGEQAEDGDADGEDSDDAEDGDDSEGDGEEAEGEGDTTDEEDAGLVVTLGDDPAPEEDDSRAAPWVRELRKSHRETVRKLREMEAENSRLRGGPAANDAPAALGPKPTMADSDFDEDAFAAKLEAWQARKAEIDTQQRKRTESEQQQRQQWESRITAVNQAGSALKVADYEEATQTVDEQLSVVQRGILLGGPGDPKTSALLRYALSKNPKKFAELSAISDPVKFAWAAAQLETQLKVEKRGRSAPPPERVVRSTVAGASGADSALARLRAEAEKTNDYSKVAAYKNEQRRKRA